METHTLLPEIEAGGGVGSHALEHDDFYSTMMPLLTEFGRNFHASVSQEVLGQHLSEALAFVNFAAKWK